MQPRASNNLGNNASSSSKRNSAKIVKVGTPSSSPHNVQRRRTTAAATTRQCPRSAHDMAVHTRDQRLKRYYGSRYSMPVVRPMSWQPGQETLQTMPQSVNVGDTTIGNTIESLENLAVTNTPPSTVQQSIENAFSMAYGFPISTPLVEHGQYHPLMAGAQATDLNFTDHSPQYPLNMSQYYMPPANSMNQDPTFQTYDSASLGIFNSSEMPSDNIPPPYHSGADNYHGYGHAQAFLDINASPQSHLSKERSGELVGIGLYNDKEPSFMSTLNANSNRESLGQELKLEESWQPPESAKDLNEEEEGYSSEEGEEEEEIPVPQTSISAEPRMALYPPFEDLASQSFFFSDDDHMNAEDHYTNYLSFGQKMQDGQSTVPVANAAPPNFMYI